ncbi:hypothetical protein [Acidovorax sp.]|uniref:hypothetical protein n=1 Tax=Acidovorax sp. TaxID=1872122 RepID=UPI00260B21B5|nr:hypothetical protein [Acidovorax sp.]
MGIYDDLFTLRGQGSLLAKLKPLEPAKLQKLVDRYPNLPSDYISFLTTIGFGEIGQAQYMIYSGLGESEFVFGEPMPPQLEKVILLGDDFQGFNAGFQTDSWEVVEIDPIDRRVDVVAPDFQTFIRRAISDLM